MLSDRSAIAHFDLSVVFEAVRSHLPDDCSPPDAFRFPSGLQENLPRISLIVLPVLRSYFSSRSVADSSAPAELLSAPSSYHNVAASLLLQHDFPITASYHFSFFLPPQEVLRSAFGFPLDFLLPDALLSLRQKSFLPIAPALLQMLLSVPDTLLILLQWPEDVDHNGYRSSSQSGSVPPIPGSDFPPAVLPMFFHLALCGTHPSAIQLQQVSVLVSHRHVSTLPAFPLLLSVLCWHHQKIAERFPSVLSAESYPLKTY